MKSTNAKRAGMRVTACGMMSEVHENDMSKGSHFLP